MKISFKDWEIKKHGKYFYRGTWDENLIKKSIAIVGSRQMTRYGGEVVDKFVSDFCLNGITTISGFMYGVDTEVAQKTVEYGGHHIAVFGCGLDVIYPSENEKLYGEILESNGLVISEYEPNAKPHLWKFPQRNKIVASLSSLGVLVIEAGENSGSLVTAKIAKKLGKKVYAVPGPITSKVSVGCNELIKSGNAPMATSIKDILSKAILANHQSQVTNHDLNILESKIFKLLQDNPMEIDEVANKLGINIVEIGQTLSLMSIKGQLSESGGKYYLNR